MKKIIAVILVLLIFISAGVFYFLKNNKKAPEIAPEKQITAKTEERTIEIINKYQKRYFDIIKRNDVLLDVSGEDTASDLKELTALFDEVKKQIQKDNNFLKEYESIEDKYKENTGNTTLEINEFAEKKYKAFDKLLNDTYKEIKNNIKKEDFEELKLSQREWLREVESYNKIFEQKDFGSIAGLIKLEYEINMRSFRTLLLMLYLKGNDIKVDDFIGQWVEILAGRIYINIENQNDKIKVTYGGANSAYSHSETIYNCIYDDKNTELICNSAKHTDQSVACRGIRADEDLEKFLECTEKYPDEEKDDYKTYSDNEEKILKIKKGTKNHFIIDDEEYPDNERKAQIRTEFENMGLYFEDDKETVYYKYKK